MFSADGQVLDRSERAGLLELAKKAAKHYTIEACCAYGSKVAGYARTDSDYDLLLVLKNYGHVIKYAYLHNEIDASILLVDSKFLIKDAEVAALGEFVVGRLLHAYESLDNSKFLEDIETRYKKRVVLEEIRELAAIKPLYSEMLIPPEYFLFSKLKKRGKAYPHALYSYAKTYSGTNAEKNTEASKHGFLRAMWELEKEGYLRLEDGFAQIVPEKIWSKNVDRASLEVLNVMRSTMAYLVHTYAGRRTLNFLKHEAVSKINRQRGIRNKIPAGLANPGSLLRLRQGMLIHEKDWLKDLAGKLGFKDYTVRRRRLGDLHAATTLYTLAENGREEHLVVKRLASVRAAKWAAMNFWVVGLKKFHVDPATRLANEYRAVLQLKRIGIETPAIIAVVPDRKLIVTEYVGGENLSEIIDSILRDRRNDTGAITEFGRALCKLHASGCTMGDTKSSNVIVKDDSVCLIDLEQFSAGDDKTWDLVCFIYYSIKFTSNEAAARRIVRAFLDGYVQEGGDPSVLKKTLSRKYVPAFYPTLVLGVVKAVRDEIRSCIRSCA